MSASKQRRSPATGIVLIIIGSILGLAALGVLAAGGGVLWADQTHRDSDGYFTASTHTFASGSYAITHEGVDIDGIPNAIDVGKLAQIRIRSTTDTGRPLFVGIARERDVDAYLAGVAHAELHDVEFDPYKADYRPIGGTGRPAAPGDQTFWVASAKGEGPTTLTWPVKEGSWKVVLMNADGSRGVGAELKVGAKIGYLGWVWGGLLIGGTILLGFAVFLIIFGVRRSGGGTEAPVGATGSPAAPMSGTYPAVLSARLDEPLNRWLWLVKWALLIPHWIVLAFLWVVFGLLTVVAWFAILFTGRYPRGIFDFNVGVLRWTWRVAYYGYGALGTDKYPPFSLGEEPDYPARLDVAYPGELSRGLIFVKWLLAVPHLLLVAVFVGGGTYWMDTFDNWHITSSTGLVGLLAIFAGFALLFTERYPRGIFDLVTGFDRWVLRVVAYTSLMTDEYPPFRLDRGGDEPDETAPSFATPVAG